MDSLISIIVPVYKVENYLEKCLRSILGQTYQNLEIILVDDGSPDNCGKMCDEYAKKDKRIKVIHKQNGGLSSARNAGIDVAKGQYIAFVDSDDYIDENYARTMLEKLLKYDVDMVCSCVIDVIENSGEMIKNTPIQKDTILVGGILDNYYSSLNRTMTVAWNKLYKRELFESIRFPLGMIYEDTAIMPKVLFACKKVAIIPETLYYYLQREGSIVASNTSKNKVDSVVTILEDHIDFLTSIEKSNFLGMEMALRFCDFGFLYRTCQDMEMKKYIKSIAIPLYKKYKKYIKINNSKSVKMLINLLYMRLF